jgi:SAM-dependent methyltransferase
LRFAEFDYQESVSPGKNSEMDGVWDAHWQGRKGLKEDLTDEPLWQTIKDELKVPGRLLEAGCGTGQWVQFLGKFGHETFGVDYAASGLEVGKRYNPNLKLIQADFRNLPFDSESFDYIVSFGAIEHDIDGPQKALREFHRILKPQGKLLCSVPCLNFYRTIGYPLLVINKWLKCRKTMRYLWGKKTPFGFYEYIWSPVEFKTILNSYSWKVLDLRGYGMVLNSKPAKLIDLAIHRIFPLSSAHMMMAICRKI